MTCLFVHNVKNVCLLFRPGPLMHWLRRGKYIFHAPGTNVALDVAARLARGNAGVLGIVHNAAMPPRKRPAAAQDTVHNPHAKKQKQPGHDLSEPDKNILLQVQKKQMEKLGPEKKAKLKSRLDMIHKRHGMLSLASFCSGSNVAFLATYTLCILLGAASPENLFDVERDSEKRRWLTEVVNENFGEACIYKEMADMGDMRAPCAVHQKRCPIPTGKAGPFLVSCGFSCKDISKANSKHQSFKHGVRQKSGNTALSLLGFVEYCEHHKPPVGLCENVAEFVAAGSSNWAEFVKLFFSIGYACKYVILNASNWVPQRRRRVYIIVLRLNYFGLTITEAGDILEEMAKTAESLAFDKPIHWSHILVDPKHPRIEAEYAEVAELASKRKPSDGNHSWPDKLLGEMAKAGICYSALSKSEVWKNDWFNTLLSREQMTLLYAMAAFPESETIDVTQSVSRVPRSSPTVVLPVKASSSSSTEPRAEELGEDADHLCSTLLCGSSIWNKSHERLLLGWEMCALQCIPCDALPGAMNMPRKLLTYLAGDAFCGAAFSAALIGLLTHLPDVPQADAQSEEHDGMYELSSLIWVPEDDV